MFIFTLLFAALAAIIAAAAPVHARDVRVAHQGIVDGSGWEGVYHVLEKEGFNVSPVLRPLPSRWRPIASPRNSCNA